MKKDMIAVCDSEAGYAGNFAEYLNARKKLPFRAEAFTDSEKLCQYAGKNCPKFLLIAEEDLQRFTKVLRRRPEVSETKLSGHFKELRNTLDFVA